MLSLQHVPDPLLPLELELLELELELLELELELLELELELLEPELELEPPQAPQLLLARSTHNSSQAVSQQYTSIPQTQLSIAASEQPGVAFPAQQSPPELSPPAPPLPLPLDVVVVVLEVSGGGDEGVDDEVDVSAGGAGDVAELCPLPSSTSLSSRPAWAQAPSPMAAATSTCSVVRKLFTGVPPSNASCELPQAHIVPNSASWPTLGPRLVSTS